MRGSPHPLLIFIYFLSAFFLCLVTLNPVLIALCYFSGIIYCGMLTGVKKLLKSLAFTVPLMLLITVINPLFSSLGATPVLYVNDSPITAEALYYGAASAAMLAAVFYWFKCYNIVMTGDRFIYVFGRVFPKLSLILVMSLALIPRFIKRYAEISDAQRAMGMYVRRGFFYKVKNALTAFSALVSWALENSIDTADSMRARGYGVNKGRSDFHGYRLRGNDVFGGVLILGLIISAAALIFTGAADFLFYPRLTSLNFNAPFIAALSAAGLLLFGAVCLKTAESAKWKFLRSKI